MESLRLLGRTAAVASGLIGWGNHAKIMLFTLHHGNWRTETHRPRRFPPALALQPQAGQPCPAAAANRGAKAGGQHLTPRQKWCNAMCGSIVCHAPRHCMPLPWHTMPWQADKKTGDGAVCPIPRQDVPLPLRVAEGRRCAITS